MSNEGADRLSLIEVNTPELRANPYPFYGRLRREEPVRWDEPLKCWVVTRYEDIAAWVGDPRLSSQRFDRWPVFRNGGRDPQLARLRELVGHMIVYLDPPAHTRIRGMVANVFTLGFIEGLRRDIEETVDELLSRVEFTGRFDVISQLSSPLTTRTIGTLLGVPELYWAQLRKWEEDLSTFLGTIDHSAEQIVAVSKSLDGYCAFFRELFDQKRRTPCDDLLGRLLLTSDRGTLSEAELFSICQLLMMAGHAAITHGIANGIRCLIGHPDQWLVLRANPDLARRAAEELLRYDSSAQMIERVTLEDVQIGGHTVPGNSVIRLVIGAANRDPDYCRDPNRLDINRKHRKSVMFGRGPHACLGGQLALLEFEVVLRKLVERASCLEQATKELKWLPTHSLRGVERLEVTLAPLTAAVAV